MDSSFIFVPKRVHSEVKPSYLRDHPKIISVEDAWFLNSLMLDYPCQRRTV